MVAAMDIRDRLLGNVAVVELNGRLTINDQPGMLHRTVSSLIDRGAQHVLLDLANVPYIDSTRLGELIAAHVSVTRKGGRLGLVAAPARIVALLAMAGLGDIFERFDTIDNAVSVLE